MNTYFHNPGPGSGIPPGQPTSVPAGDAAGYEDGGDRATDHSGSSTPAPSEESEPE